MISDIRIHSSHEAVRDSSSVRRRPLPLMCPHCQKPIQLSIGLCGNRLIEAILLQAERIGTELECQQCGLRFVFHRTRQSRPLPGMETGRNQPPIPFFPSSSTPAFHGEDRSADDSLADRDSSLQHSLHRAPETDLCLP